MSQEMYIGMGVHQATISVVVMDGGGRLIMKPERFRAAGALEQHETH